MHSTGLACLGSCEGFALCSVAFSACATDGSLMMCAEFCGLPHHTVRRLNGGGVAAEARCLHADKPHAADQIPRPCSYNRLCQVQGLLSSHVSWSTPALLPGPQSAKALPLHQNNPNCPACVHALAQPNKHPPPPPPGPPRGCQEADALTRGLEQLQWPAPRQVYQLAQA